jgi:hypothetical protein
MLEIRDRRFEMGVTPASVPSIPPVLGARRQDPITVDETIDGEYVYPVAVSFHLC